jgi:hypothetical protein
MMAAAPLPAGAPTPVPVARTEVLTKTTAVLPVPVPSERIRPENVTYATREGQAEFRENIIAAYGQCAITGCTEKVALQAAHIIPYVDARSHLISNGICLRADIHCLFDRGLISISDDLVVSISMDVQCSDYRALHGRKLALPTNVADAPDACLLRVRHQYI